MPTQSVAAARTASAAGGPRAQPRAGSTHHHRRTTARAAAASGASESSLEAARAQNTAAVHRQVLATIAKNEGTRQETADAAASTVHHQNLSSRIEGARQEGRPQGLGATHATDRAGPPERGTRVETEARTIQGPRLRLTQGLPAADAGAGGDREPERSIGAKQCQLK